MSKPIIAVLAATLLSGACWGVDNVLPGLDRQDADFARGAALCSMLEVHASDMALKRGLSGDDKIFAQLMLENHGSATKELGVIAEKKGITLPAEFDAKHLELLEAVGKANDKDVAERYLEIQIKAHKEAIELFSTQADAGKDADLKAYAMATLPVLKIHLEQARKLEEKH